MAGRRRKALTAAEKDAAIDSILVLMRDGPAESLTQACKKVGVSHGQFLSWVEADKGDLKDRYARARTLLMDRIAEGLIDLADNDPLFLPTGAIDSASVAHRKLQIDTRKWVLSKLAPKKYGEKLDLSSEDGSMSPSISVSFVKSTSDLDDRG